MPKAEPMGALETIPAAIEAERCVLGAILLDNTVLLSVTEILSPGAGRWFHDEAHHLIYDAIMTLSERRDPIDMTTLTDVLHRRGHLEKVGGSVYLAELLETVTTTVNAAHHARLVREKLLFRSLINVASEMSARAFEQDDILEIVSQPNDSLLRVINAQSVSSFVDMPALMNQTIHQAENADEQSQAGILSGFYDLDHLTHGFQRSDLIVLAARPSMGKTSIALQIAQHAAQTSERTVAFFSLEMSAAQLGHRLLCSEARLNSAAVRRGGLGHQAWGALMNAANRLRELPLLIDDTSGLTMTELRARAKRLQMERGLAMILVDYLQLLRPSRRKESRTQEVTEMSQDLKALARELNIPVIVLSQLNREIERRDNKVPQLSDLRECVTGDQIIYDAHTGLKTTVRAIAEGRTTFVNGLNSNLKATSARVSMAWSTGIKPVLKLRTRTGRTLRATVNQPMRTIKGWVPLASIRIGECIAVPREVPQPPLATDLLSDDELKMIGYLISDGHYGKHRTISYVKADPSLCADVRRIAFERFGIVAKAKRPRGISEEMDLTGPGSGPGSNELINWLKSLGIHGQIGAHKRVPDILWSHTNRALAVFLGALWAGDGSVVPRKRGGWVLKFTNTSMGLLDDIHWILTRLGILAVRGPIEFNSKSKVGISTISIGESEAMLRFADLVPMRGVKGYKLREC